MGRGRGTGLGAHPQCGTNMGEGKSGMIELVGRPGFGDALSPVGSRKRGGQNTPLDTMGWGEKGQGRATVRGDGLHYEQQLAGMEEVGGVLGVQGRKHVGEPRVESSGNGRVAPCRPGRG